MEQIEQSWKRLHLGQATLLHPRHLVNFRVSLQGLQNDFVQVKQFLVNISDFIFCRFYNMNATTKLVWLIASYQPVDHMNSELENAIFLMIYFIS